MNETNLRKNSVNNPVCKCMVTISNKVLLVNQEVVIGIKLPELAIDHVEVFIREVPAPKKFTLIKKKGD